MVQDVTATRSEQARCVEAKLEVSTPQTKAYEVGSTADSGDNGANNTVAIGAAAVAAGAIALGLLAIGSGMA